MNESHRVALRIVFVSLALGALADALLRVGPWGVNAAVLAVAMTVALVALSRGNGAHIGVRRWVHAFVAVALGLGFVWREAAVLKLLDVLSLAVVFGLMAAERGESVGQRTLSAYAVRLGGSAVHAAVGVPLLLGNDVSWSELRVGSALHRLLAIVRGLTLALPVLVVFALLLGGADPVFAARLREVVDVDVVTAIGHIIGTLTCAAVAAGLLRAAVLRTDPESASLARPEWLRLGTTEMAILLGLLDILFATFVWIQIRYFFGGADRVQHIAGLTYSEYARSGFFELVWVVALVLTLLLVVHWLLPNTRPIAARVFAVLGGIQIALVLVVLVSAILRMRLYQAEYGQTQLRLYTTAFMLWLGGLLVGFVATVFRARRAAFAQWTAASAVVVILALHAANPEVQIVEANRRAPHGFDVSYARHLSADAAPSLVAVARELRGEPQRQLAQHLVDRWATPDPDWRRWSLARWRAHRWVGDAEADLRAMSAR
jgi:hypothetical protein